MVNVVILDQMIRIWTVSSSTFWCLSKTLAALTNKRNQTVKSILHFCDVYNVVSHIIVCEYEVEAHFFKKIINNNII